MLTQERVRGLFDYDPDDGVLVWKKLTRRCRRVRVGKRVDSYWPNGYTRVGIDGKRYLAHKVIWLWVHGIMPKEIDHINGIRHDNRIANLRVVTRSQNNINKAGVHGVYQAPSGKWYGRITVNYRTIELGTFSTYDEAVAARRKAERQHFGKYAPGRRTP